MLKKFLLQDSHRKSKSLISRHENTSQIQDNSSTKTPELRSRLLLPGFPGFPPKIPQSHNLNNRPLTAKIVNISRISHSKEPNKKEEFFLLPHYADLQPKAYPKLKKRPNSFNYPRSDLLDQSKSILNNRYNEKEDSNYEKTRPSFYLKKSKPMKPSLTKEAQNSLLKTMGKPENLPYLQEASAINPYDMFQKLLKKSKEPFQQPPHKKKALFSKNLQIFDFSFNEPVSKFTNLSKLQLNTSFVPEKEDLENQKLEEKSLIEDSELAYIKIKTIEEFIEMIKNKEVHPAEFIYLLKSKQSDAYDLKVVSYFTITRLKSSQYFTLSPKGLTCFEKGLPKEFIFLGDWLRERDQYFALKSLSFFKKFRKWKTLKKWQKLLQIRRNKKIAIILSDNLFHVHSIYQKILLRHRNFTATLENLRLLDFPSIIEIKTLEEFSELQAKKRRLIFDYLQVLSEQMHESCKEGLKVLMNRIKDHIRSELSEEDEQFGLMKKAEELQKIGETKQNTNQLNKNLIEILNLPDKLSYQHRSLLRSECLKVLRFAYLLDFLTLDSLANVYMCSLNDFLEKIRKARIFPDQKRISSAELPSRKKFIDLDPFLLIKARFLPDFLRKEQPKIVEIEVDGFDIANHIEDFDLSRYAEFTDPPFQIDESIVPNVEKTILSNEKALHFTLPKKINPESINPKDSFIIYKRKPQNLAKLWLEFVPKKPEFMQFLTSFFTEGLHVLQSVRKWSKSPEFLIYSNTLEAWDQIIGDSWLPQPEHQYLDVSSWLKQGKYANCERLLNEILKLFEKNIMKIEDFRAGFEVFLDIYWRVRNTDFAEILQNETLARPQENISFLFRFFEFAARFSEENLKEGADFGLFHIDCAEISKEIKAFLQEIIGKVQNTILEVYRNKAKKMRVFLLNSLKKVANIVLKIEDYIELKENIDKITQKLVFFKGQKEKLELISQVLQDEKIVLTKEDKDIFLDIPRFETQLANKMQEIEASSNRTIERFNIKLSENYIRFRGETQELQIELLDPIFLGFTEEFEEILEKLRALKLRIEALSSDVDKYRNFAYKLQIPGFETLEELESAKKEAEIKLLLWESMNDWLIFTNNWAETPFVKIDVEDLGEKSEKYWKIAQVCEKNLTKNEVLNNFKGKVNDFREIFPVVSALKSPFLKNSHWNELYEMIFNDFTGDFLRNKRKFSKIKDRRSLFFENLEFTSDNIAKIDKKEAIRRKSNEKSLKSMIFQPDFTLNSLFQLNLLGFKEEIVEISVKAQQETSLEKSLIDLERNFEEKALYFKPISQFSDILLLSDIEEIFIFLDSLISGINFLLSSRYSAIIKKSAENLQKNVLFFSDLLEKWLETQNKWLYFARIFSMNEVRKDLYSQVVSFEANDKTLKLLIKRISINSSFSKLLRFTGLVDQFIKILDSFSKLERELEAYLDAKRSIFPRLYFLSNEELLDLLSKSQEINEIQPFLLKIFENVKKIVINADLSIQAIISIEGEVLELKKLSFFKGSLENWLENLLVSIQETLRRLLRKGFQDNLASGLDKIGFLNSQIGQIANLVLAVNWNLAIEAILIEKNQKGLEEIYEISQSEFVKLAKNLQENVENSAISQGKLRNQLIYELFLRDFLQKMICENVDDINDFLWLQNLRIYHNPDMENSNELLILKQLNFLFPYCFEYQGLKSRLVLTPLTNRCFLTITTAFCEGLGTSLWGPAGTGKTETVKELAKFAGVFCIVYNCSEQVSIKTLNQLLTGLISQGVWGCLDEFNRLNIEVLSAISQVFLIVRMAWLLKQSDIEIDCKNVVFKRKTFAFCITMNPGYKSRRELPENLKALLRPIYMILPNSEIIAEVLLISQGFDKARQLSQKIASFYLLCENQLSNQKHYDFGLRSLKFLLMGLGNSRKSLANINEEILIIQALRKANSGKLTSEDSSLFEKLLTDIFPENALFTDKFFDENEAKFKGSCEELGFQINPNIIGKVLNLHQNLPFRTGLILLGVAKTGKTTALRILSHSYEISLISLNPKTVALNELFGVVMKNGEWKEGLASFLIKENNLLSNEKKDKGWIIFDGPIESLWIENLNSVLDDNKTLCLANSERIKLTENMRFFFETDDLQNSSPATISRCGVVFFEEIKEIWLWIFETWIEKLRVFQGKDSMIQKDLNEEIMEMIKDLGMKVLKEGFEKLEGYGEELIGKRCIKGVLNVFEAIVDKEEVELEGDKGEVKRRLNYIWAYAFLWGACAVVDIPNNKIEAILKDTFKNLLFPFTDNIFTLRMDPFNYSSFTLCPQNFEHPIPTSKPFLFLPCSDLIPYLFIFKALISHKKPILLSGPPSSLKTTAILHFFESFSPDNEEFNLNIESFIYPLFRTCSPKLLQNFIEKSCDKKNKSLYGSKPGKINVFFLDDLNLSSYEYENSGRSLELLRQILEYSGLYDPSKFFWKSIEDTAFLTTYTETSRINKNPQNSRLFNNFQQIHFNPPSLNLMKRLFETYVNDLFLSGGFHDDVKSLSNGIISASMEFFRRIRENFKPVPRKFAYEFSIRELVLMFKGLSLAKSNVFLLNNKEGFLKLWLHENYRVFYDRLNNDNDALWFKENLKSLTNQFLQFSIEINTKTCFFSDILKIEDPNPQFLYEEIKDFSKIQRFLEGLLVETSKIDSFILSSEVIGYLLRLIRIPKLATLQKNVLNLGIIGFGKKSLCKLAALIRKMPIWEFNTTGREAFQEDFRNFIIKALISKDPYMLIFNENAFDSEEILAKIALLMNPLTPITEIHEDFEDLVTEALKNIKNKDQSISFEFKNKASVMIFGSYESPGFVKGLRDFNLMRFCSGIIQYSAWGYEALLNVAQGLLLETPKLATLVVEIYQIVENEVNLQNSQKKTKVFLSPKNYVEMLLLFKELHEKQEKTLTMKIKTLDNGLNKLAASQTLVSSLNKSLLALEPQLIQQSQKTEEIYKKLALDHSQANEKEVLIIQESEAMNIEMNSLQILVAEAQNDLEMAYPALKEAQAALNALNKNDIAEIRTFNNPPPIVAMVLEAVCMLLEEKTDWNSIKTVVTDIDFLSRLTALDKEKIKDNTIRKLRGIIHKPEFNPENIGQKSLACKSLAFWCKAIENYYRVERMVRPRRAKAQEMNKMLNEKKKNLTEKTKELELARAKLSELQLECDSNLALRQQVMQEIEKTRSRLMNSEKLNILLSSEEIKWNLLLEKYEFDLSTILGDTLLLSACLSYYGPFKPLIRDKLFDNWQDRFIYHDIHIRNNYKLNTMLFTETQIGKWVLKGLPNDDRAIENGVLIMGNQKPCLILDPENIALNWLKISKYKILIPNPLNKTLLNTALAQGETLVIDNFIEPLEDVFQIILERKVLKIDGINKLMFSDGLFPFEENFRLILISRDPEIVISSSLFLKTNVVNFQVTFEGLSDQLLSEVIALEKPDLETSFNEINAAINRDKENLTLCEERILALLDRPSEFTILDDQELLSTLETSKRQSEEIQRNLSETVKIEEKILISRGNYKEIAGLGSSLYFTIKSLIYLEPIYYHSLEMFKKTYKLAFIKKPNEKNEDLEKRLKGLMKEIMKVIFEKVGIGLFLEHKLVFALAMISDFNRRKGLIPENLWDLFFNRKSSSNQINSELAFTKNKPNWIKEDLWFELMKFALILKGDSQLFFLKNFNEKTSEWKKFIDNPLENIMKIPIPPFKLQDFGPINFSLQNQDLKFLDFLIKAFFLKIFKPDALILYLNSWIFNYLGLPVRGINSMEIDKVFGNLDNKTPLLIILSSGTDPQDLLLRFSKEKRKILQILTLNNVSNNSIGKKSQFSTSFEKAKETGTWVFIQNCHLSLNSLSEITKILENELLSCHQEFRLILTTNPIDFFPLSLISKVFKFAFQKQQTFKSALKEVFNEIPNEDFEAFEKQSNKENWLKTLFNLSVFHAILRTRGNFGSLGFSKPYEFNFGDFEISKSLLKRGFANGAEIEDMTEVLTYLIGHINYGGRVLEDLDLKVIFALLRKYLNNGDNLKLFKDSMSSSGLKKIIEELPENDDPEIYGLHENALILLRNSMMKRVFENMNKGLDLIMEFSDIKSKETVVLNIIEELKALVPGIIDKRRFFEKRPEFEASASSLCLLREIERFNDLIEIVQRNLDEIHSLINGEIVNTPNLEELFNCLYQNKVPSNWLEKEFISMKGLGGWMEELMKKVGFIKEWISDENLQNFWLGGLLDPKRLLKGVLQDFSRWNKIPLVKLALSYKVEDYHYEKLTEGNKINSKENGSIFVYGLFLEAGVWDIKQETLANQKNGQLYFEMPMVQVIPYEMKAEENENYEEKQFECPLLKTHKSVLELKQNLIGFMDLKIKSKSNDFWVLKGANLICQKEE